MVALLAAWPAMGAASTPCNPSIAVEGNKTLGKRLLTKSAAQELKDFGDNGCRPADIDDAAYQMETLYRSRGYAFARVAYRITPQEKKVAVVFEVSEGPLVTVDAVNISGNAHLDSTQLNTFFRWQSSSGGGESTPIFTQSALDQALSQAADSYILQGFRDVVIDKPRLAFNDDRTRVTIDVPIREGTQYIVREVHVREAPDDREIPCKPSLCEPLIGAPYYRRNRAMLNNALVNTYRNNGYAWAKALVNEETGNGPGDVVLIATVTPGSIATIDRVVIKGNTKTRETFIRSRLNLLPGDVYSEEKERKSFRELFRTGLFSTIDMEIAPTGKNGCADLLITVKEAASTELYVEPGWGSYEFARIKVGAKQRNLFGTGMIFNPEAGASTKDHRLSLRLTDPWFFDTSVTADMPTYYSYREEPSFTRNDLGFSVTFSRPFGDAWKGSSGYSLQKTDVVSLDDQTNADLAPTDYDLGSVTVQATRDTRNDVLFPTGGQRLFLAVEHADRFLGGSITLTRFSGGWRYFHSLGDKTVIGLRYSAGMVAPGQADVTLPISERFFNGGGNSIRSFKESDLGPKSDTGESVGGYGYNTVNAELRQRLYGNLVGELFCDIGNVSPNQTRDERGLPAYTDSAEVVSETLDTFFSGFRYGIGAGLMYMLPIGPLRADLALNPDADKDRGEDTFVFHFSIGASF